MLARNGFAFLISIVLSLAIATVLTVIAHPVTPAVKIESEFRLESIPFDAKVYEPVLEEIR